jgi:prepilin-type N-terminal cleavage/methylation domain-containing protein
MLKNRAIGFTLAELLIALAILGVIATFTIPKIISAQQNGANNSKAKEAAALMTSALKLYSLSNTITSNTSIQDLTPYMNYTQLDSTGTIDDVYQSGSIACNSWGSGRCIRLHNGAFILYWTGDTFNGTSSLNGVPFLFDPDGVYSGTTNGPGKSVMFFLYANGRIKDYGNIDTGTTYSGGTETRNAAGVPPWFSW